MKFRSLFISTAVACLLLPRTSAAQENQFPSVEGWKLFLEETAYTPNNLFEVIDGAADLFLEYNFVDLHIGRYTQGELDIKVELYRHATDVDAFGMYSQERFADYHFIEIGVQGYLEKGTLNFLAGRYYVKLSTIQEGENAQSVMQQLAKAVEMHLHQGTSLPGILAAFPTENKRPFTEQYIAKSFLGYSPLNGVFVTSYDDGAPYRLFVIRLKTPEEALTTLKDLDKALPASATRSGEGAERSIADPNNGGVMIVLKGSNLLGIVSTEAVNKRGAVLEVFGKRLSSLR
jgi:hypothetical protein